MLKLFQQIMNCWFTGACRHEQNQSEQRLQRERGRFAVVSRLEAPGATLEWIENQIDKDSKRISGNSRSFKKADCPVACDLGFRSVFTCFLLAFGFIIAPDSLNLTAFQTMPQPARECCPSTCWWKHWPEGIAIATWCQTPDFEDALKERHHAFAC
jgi:hypothetical protein